MAQDLPNSPYQNFPVYTYVLHLLYHFKDLDEQAQAECYCIMDNATCLKC